MLHPCFTQPLPFPPITPRTVQILHAPLPTNSNSTRAEVLMPILKACLHALTPVLLRSSPWQRRGPRVVRLPLPAGRHPVLGQPVLRQPAIRRLLHRPRLLLPHPRHMRMAVVRHQRGPGLLRLALRLPQHAQQQRVWDTPVRPHVQRHLHLGRVPPSQRARQPARRRREGARGRAEAGVGPDHVVPRVAQPAVQRSGLPGERRNLPVCVMPPTFV